MPPPAAPRHQTATATAPDGLTLFEQRWQPEGPARAAVLLVHGLADHSGRYAHVAAHLAAQGFAVHAYDQRGHGRSGGRRAFVHRFSEYLDDLAVVLDRTRAAHPGRPLFLFGHSMGAVVAALYDVERPGEVDGLILSSPAVCIGMDAPPVLVWLVRLLSRLLPAVPTVKIDRTDLSRDPEVVAQTGQDPLYYHGGIPARTAVELAGAGEAVRQHLDRITGPLLVFHGTADRIADARGGQYIYAQAASEDKTLALFDGLYHETLNEPEQAQVLREITDWLDEHVG